MFYWLLLTFTDEGMQLKRIRIKESKNYCEPWLEWRILSMCELHGLPRRSLQRYGKYRLIWALEVFHKSVSVGKEAMTPFQAILCTPLYVRWPHFVRLLSFIPLQVPPQVWMHTRHWSKFLAIFRVPIRCRHMGLLSKFSRY